MPANLFQHMIIGAAAEDPGNAESSFGQKPSFDLPDATFSHVATGAYSSHLLWR
jgi:hypothetical protein